jgi:hypothetical protein
MPGFTAFSIPEDEITAFEFVQLQTPPGAASVYTEVNPAHSKVAPVIVPASGIGVTTTTCVADTEPHPLV